jgi:hypothetical protein
MWTLALMGAPIGRDFYSAPADGIKLKWRWWQAKRTYSSMWHKNEDESMEPSYFISIAKLHSKVGKVKHSEISSVAPTTTEPEIFCAGGQLLNSRQPGPRLDNSDNRRISTKGHIDLKQTLLKKKPRSSSISKADGLNFFWCINTWNSNAFS